MSKKKKGRITKQKGNVSHSIDTSDPRRNTKFGLWALKNIQKVDSWSAPFYFVAKWDKRLGFKLIRLILLTIPTLILLPDKLLEWVLGIHAPLLNTLPGLKNIMGIYENIFTWIFSMDVPYVLLIHVIFPLSLLAAIVNFMKTRKIAYKKINFGLLFSIFLDTIAAYGSVKYQTPELQQTMTIMLVILTIMTIWELFFLKRYHKEHGSYDPGKLLKQGERRAKKRGRREINSKKA
ncbi:hypothetical protein [Paenibacillus campi]|uniref:hypothetical protein n=1 Tax=Paenibacillus campi TaxID=3106031 RepID=UPI002B0034C6|nr:hypothetical protein [Paenibacillus sp. SGZ-1009]